MYSLLKTELNIDQLYNVVMEAIFYRLWVHVFDL